MPAEGDWPEGDEGSGESWEEAKAELAASVEEMARALEAVAEERLGERVGAERDRELGVGVTYGAMVLGVLQHNAYHSGQIAFIRKALASR